MRRRALGSREKESRHRLIFSDPAPVKAPSRYSLLFVLLACLVTGCAERSPEGELSSPDDSQQSSVSSDDTAPTSGSDPVAAPPDKDQSSSGSAEAAELDSDEEAVEGRSLAALFELQTRESIDEFFDANGEIETIMDLVTSKQFQELRDARLGKWEPSEEMKQEITDSFRAVAAAQGVDPSLVGNKNPQINPNISIEIDGNRESLGRVVGFVIEGREKEYGGELMRILDQAVMDSVINPERAPLRITPKGP